MSEPELTVDALMHRSSDSPRSFVCLVCHELCVYVGIRQVCVVIQLDSVLLGFDEGEAALKEKADKRRVDVGVRVQRHRDDEPELVLEKMEDRREEFRDLGESQELARFYYELGQLYQSLGREDEAMLEFIKASSADPDGDLADDIETELED